MPRRGVRRGWDDDARLARAGGPSLHGRPRARPVRARDPDRHGEPRLRSGGRPLPVPERARAPLRPCRRLPRRHPPVAAQLPGAHVGLDAGARRVGLLPRRRLPQRRPEHLRPDPLAGLRREHARPLRPVELGRLCAPPQPRGLLHARGGRLRRRRRAPDRACPRSAPRAPGGLHVHRPEPLQRRARLPGRPRRRLARAVGAADHVLAGVPVGADRALHHLRRGRPQRGQPRLHRRRGPSVRPGTVSRRTFTHYSMLRTQEELLGLPALGRAASAASMASAFHLAG